MSSFDLSAILGPVRSVIDVGMYEGEFTRDVIRKFDPEWILGVEMLPEKAAILQSQKCFHDLPKKIVYQYAAGAIDTRLRIQRVPAVLQASSLLKINSDASKWYGRDLRQATTPGFVGVRPLDRLVEKWCPGEIDLMKIDVQGYEGRVLAGAKNVLSRTRQIVIEILFRDVYAGQSTERQIVEALYSHGFVFDRWIRNDAPLEGDALFVKV